MQIGSTSEEHDINITKMWKNDINRILNAIKNIS